MTARALELGSQRIIIGHGGPIGDMPPLPGSSSRQQRPLNQYVSQVQSPEPAPVAATQASILNERALEQQNQLLLRRYAALQPQVEQRPTGTQMLATGSRDTGGSLHERRGRQF